MRETPMSRDGGPPSRQIEKAEYTAVLVNHQKMTAVHLMAFRRMNGAGVGIRAEVQKCDEMTTFHSSDVSLAHVGSGSQHLESYGRYIWPNLPWQVRIIGISLFRKSRSADGIHKRFIATQGYRELREGLLWRLRSGFLL
jgi:hypothetical protein